MDNKTALVCDTGGLFLPVARRLARDFGEVYYTSEWVESMPTVNRAWVGRGFKDVIRVNDPYDVLSKIDLAVFPDCSHASLQAHLEELGVALWGSRQGVELELDRQLWMGTLEDIGLDVPPYVVANGLTELEEELVGHEDCYVKVSRYRGTMETKHWRSWDVDQWWLADLKVRLGPAGELVEFIVCDAIPNAVEIGVDTYCVDGRWPDTMLHGVEAKDKAYMGAVTQWKDMPYEATSLLLALSDKLEELNYRNQVSVELRVTDKEAYPIDFTARGGLPSTASQLELWENFSQIVWAGAHGEAVQPVAVASYAGEVALSVKSEPGQWGVVEVPKELDQWVKLGGCCVVKGKHCFAPEPGGHDDHVGWLVATGDSPQEVVDTLIERAAQLPDGMSASLEALAQVIKTVEEEARKGIEFSDKPMPDKGAVLEDTQ